ncbi:MAG TPA: glutamate--tRNA ligase [Steroidobacteraceae bacterium]|nr:glutamate--tRNA ligase [Steroidobacteraceae bacterium]
MGLTAASAATAAPVTRFAPSPTGDLHLGNARTALFNLLLARRAGGRFVLRVEDTDAERSRDEFRERQIEDLRWLGIDWDAGPDREDARGPYRQSQRAALYARDFDALAAAGHVYLCYCSALELELARKAQLASGKPPRYAGTCRELTAEQQARKRAAGIAPTLRFRVPAGRRVEFVDLVHGPQSFLSDDIGDFVVRRADGSAAFFFSNAVDDARMGVTHVLRGEDHLANTPRQLLVLEALGLASPAYGHVSLLLGADGTKLSKRAGAGSVREYRESGYLPAAIVNHLFRLGHSTTEHGLLGPEEMARAFEPQHLGRSPAHFDPQQLTGWQREAVRRLEPQELRRWLEPELPEGLDTRTADAFIEAVRPNVVLPADARLWADVVFGGPPALDEASLAAVRDAGREYFAAAARAAEANGNDLPAVAGAVRTATGRKGAALYTPLRAALTGRAHGPELAPLMRAMPPGKVRERLARFA